SWRVWPARAYFRTGRSFSLLPSSHSFEIERQLARADKLVKHILERIFHMGIERRGHVGLGPQVADGVGTTKFEAYDVVNFILTGLMRSDPIGPVYLVLHTLRYIPHSLGIARRADDLGVGGQDITRRQCWK